MELRRCPHKVIIKEFKFSATNLFDYSLAYDTSDMALRYVPVLPFHLVKLKERYLEDKRTQKHM